LLIELKCFVAISPEVVGKSRGFWGGGQLLDLMERKLEKG